MLESITLRESGTVEIPLLYDDPLVFDKILSIMHGRNVSLRPEESHVEFLASFAVAVDKYGFFDCTRELATNWARSVKAQQYVDEQTCLGILRHKAELGDLQKGPQCLYWLRIAYVFKIPDMFKDAATDFYGSISIKELEELKDVYGIPIIGLLPIPYPFLESSLVSQQQKVNSAMVVLRDFVAGLDSVFRDDLTKKKDRDLIREKLEENLNPFNLWPIPDPQHLEAKILISDLSMVLRHLWSSPYEWDRPYPQWYFSMAKGILAPLEKKIWSEVPVFNIEDYPSRLGLRAHHRP
ncbi:hypothetical protein GLAREA_06382 [Glarea lozoyensis ATCC 20868]|uniref:BTB domain-containing protein n=1 Tax=Glarea lozoyensis (strain ATCC 20868 / MF5171) TaxID=1116229 RepID=S3D8B8_GLAL2|nr:uncharacterized protein GLAREA_06382 [Glarea lozoyensis ATCC 20868]EPE33369.1 hypothetical protein GLAREA_06382 [Glarea lozoyensis ATCC 20868]